MIGVHTLMGLTSFLKREMKQPSADELAKIAEKRKDLRGALKYYTRSLQVEWNQPPVIEAKRRLENEIAKQSGEAR